MNRWPYWVAGGLIVIVLDAAWSWYVTAGVGSAGVSKWALLPSAVLAVIGCGMVLRALVLVLRELEGP